MEQAALGKVQTSSSDQLFLVTTSLVTQVYERGLRSCARVVLHQRIHPSASFITAVVYHHIAIVTSTSSHSATSRATVPYRTSANIHHPLYNDICACTTSTNLKNNHFFPLILPFLGVLAAFYKFHWTSKVYATLTMGNRFLGVQISIIWVVFAVKTVTLLWQPAKAQDIASECHSSTVICC